MLFLEHLQGTPSPLCSSKKGLKLGPEITIIHIHCACAFYVHIKYNHQQDADVLPTLTKQQLSLLKSRNTLKI